MILAMGGSQIAPDSIPPIPGLLIAAVLFYVVIRKRWWKP